MPENSTQFIYTEELYKIPGPVIILIPSPWEEVAEDDRLLLNKILGSVKLSLSGVQIIHQQKVAIQALKIFNPAVILSFGVPLTPGADLYQLQSMDAITLIQSDSLSALTDATKKELWSALKKLSTLG